MEGNRLDGVGQAGTHGTVERMNEDETSQMPVSRGQVSGSAEFLPRDAAMLARSWES